MECGSCRSEMPDDARLCNECGAPLRILCAACDTVNPPSAKFCSHCGGSLIERVHSASIKPVGVSEAERRHLTVMFCDIIGSTEISSRLDPEDLSALIRTYQNRVAESILSFGGFIARYVGDGVLIYFGWPRASETDAEQAIRASLRATEAVATAPIQGEMLRLRIGIASGLVVIGDPIGAGDSRQQTAIGETPNRAARLQALAGPNGVVIDAATRLQIGGLFDCQDLGKIELKGLPDAVPAWLVLGERLLGSRFEALHGNTIMPLVGRNQELELLLRRWRQAKAGEGQVVLLVGDPGIGKSRLITAVVDELSQEAPTRLRYFCSPHQSDSALRPFISQLERASGFAQSDTAEDRLEKLDNLLKLTHTSGEDAALIADLLSLPRHGRYPTHDLSPQRRRQRTLDALVGQFDRLTLDGPVLMTFEDAHWADPTSLELLGHIVVLLQQMRGLAIVSYRPEFVPPWAGESHATSLTLSRLSVGDAATLVQRIAGDAAIAGEVVAEIVARADGVPLFLEELTKTVLESDREDVSNQLALMPNAAATVPATLYTSLLSRLDRLRPGKMVAQIGAAIGREFSYELVAAIAEVPAWELRQALDQLIASGLIFSRGVPPNVTYLFKHALVVDVAYGTLLRGRRHELHTRIARLLEEGQPEEVEAQPELLAYHLTRAGLAEKAVRYWLRAGERAASAAANKEAISHLQTGIGLLGELADSPEKLRLERDLNSAVLAVLQARHGYGADIVGRAANRALDLSRQTGDAAKHAEVLWHAWVYRWWSGDRNAEILAQELLELGERVEDPKAAISAHVPAGLNDLFDGHPIGAQRHLALAARKYENLGGSQITFRYGFEFGAIAYAFGAWSLAILGYLDQAQAGLQTAAEIVEQARQPFSTARGSNLCSAICSVWRDWPAAREFGERALRAADEHGFEMVTASSSVVRGVAQAMLNPKFPVPTEVRDGLERYGQSGAKRQMTYLLTLSAEVSLVRGNWDGGLQALLEAEAVIAQTGERQVEAEVHRLRGDLLVGLGRGDAGTHLMRALEIARAQQARLFELRAARSLAWLWFNQGKVQEARTVLTPIYDWFTEGFDMPDLLEARELVTKLANRSA
jgi:class 3 adenylate cyclase